jgi:hypothetical protein
LSASGLAALRQDCVGLFRCGLGGNPVSVRERMNHSAPHGRDTDGCRKRQNANNYKYQWCFA